MRKLWTHAAALLIVLLGLVAIVDPGWPFSADEGAAIIEARSLSRGDGWLVDHPFPAADPGGTRYPLELSEWGEEGIAPYAKHPAYPLLLAGADRVAGTTGMVLLSVLGTVGAACAGALLARRVRPGTDIATFWMLGVLSPLCFDALWVIAHSLAAALVGAAVLAALRAADRGRVSAWSAVAGVGLAAATALRTEVAFLAAGVVLVALWHVWTERSRAWAATAVAVAAGVTGVRLLERELLTAIVGAARVRPEFGSDVFGGFLGDRWSGFVRTWLSADPRDHEVASLLLLAAGACAAVAVWQVLRRQPDATLLRGGAVLFAAFTVLRVVVVPASAIPGLLVAFPLLWIGLVVGRGEGVRHDPGRTLAVITGVGVVGILATQYRTGGSAEWGGRYFAVALPLVAPLVVVGLAAARERLDAPTARLLAGSLLVASLAGTSLVVLTLRSSHASLERGIALVEQAAEAAGPDRVVVTTDPALPRLGWPAFGRLRWLLIDVDRDGDAARDLAAAGVDRFVLVAPELDATMAALGVERVESPFDRSRIAVVELHEGG